MMVTQPTIMLTSRKTMTARVSIIEAVFLTLSLLVSGACWGKTTESVREIRENVPLP
jgi:hypothetical protein